MKYAKMLGLLAVAAAALMAFAGTASATQVTSPSGTLYTGALTATNVGGLTLHGVADVTCNNSTVSGSIESHGASVTAKGKIGTGNLTFTNCNQHVKVLAEGSLEAHASGGAGGGTLTSSGAEVTVEFTTIFGNVHCVFGTSNTLVGNVTAATENGTHATLDIDSSPIPVKSGSFLCGSSAEWTGNYKVTSPTGLRLD
ncbi:MAG TPA: hypothetical protein VI039_02000 [Solirubrobacterales bacterium]